MNFKLIRLLGFFRKWFETLQACSRDQLGKNPPSVVESKPSVTQYNPRQKGLGLAVRGSKIIVAYEVPREITLRSNRSGHDSRLCRVIDDLVLDMPASLSLINIMHTRWKGLLVATPYTILAPVSFILRGEILPVTAVSPIEHWTTTTKRGTDLWEVRAVPSLGLLASAQ